MISLLRRIIARHHQRKAMARLEELRQQTLRSYERQRYVAYRRAALKGRRKAGA